MGVAAVVEGELEGMVVVAAVASVVGEGPAAEVVLGVQREAWLALEDLGFEEKAGQEAAIGTAVAVEEEALEVAVVAAKEGAWIAFAVEEEEDVGEAIGVAKVECQEQHSHLVAVVAVVVAWEEGEGEHSYSLDLQVY